MFVYLLVAYGCYDATTAELSSCYRDPMATNPKMLHTAYPFKNSLPTTELEERSEQNEE